MDNIVEYVNIDHCGLGLTNQIGKLTSGIMVGKFTNKKYVIVSKFRCQYNNEKSVPISEIIDLDNLSTDCNIKIMDLSNFDFKIIFVKYGTCQDQVDITDVIGDVIPKSLNLNDLKGDPSPGTVKKLFIKYSVNNDENIIIYKEKCYDDITLSAKYLKYHSNEWISTYDIDYYDQIIKSIKFNQKFYTLAKQFIQPHIKFNIIHLRNEEDALLFWSKINNMPIPFFKDKLQNKYVTLVNKYIKKEDLTIILTSNNNCQLINYFINNKYNIKLTIKNFDDERELNAIVDLLVSEYCNDIFIGGINPINYHGSTFSYLIWKRLNPNTKKILFDLDRIDDHEFIIN